MAQHSCVHCDIVYLALSYSHDCPNSHGHTEHAQHDANQGEGPGGGETCLICQGDILGLLGVLLGAPQRSGYLTNFWQAYWELNVCRGFDVIKLSTP